MASSTKIPIENIKANKLTRSIVNPINQATKTVDAIMTGIIANTTTPARQPNASQIKSVTMTVTLISFANKVFTLARADAP